MRDKIFEYVRNKYGVEPDYPFPNAPTFPVMRHSENRKWFALIMDVDTKKLSPDMTGRADIINLKPGDMMLVDFLAQQPGYFYGYHISRGSWISILLDGTVPFDEICRWIDESYAVTAPKKPRRPLV